MAKAQPAAPASADSLGRLKEEVINPGLCVACGACVGLCPHLIFYEGRLAAPDACGLSEGRCYDLCPQALYPPPEKKSQDLHQTQGGSHKPPLGPMRQVWQARALDPAFRQGAQYGGVVSALATLVLETGLAQEAVLTRAGENGAPFGVRVKDRQGVLACAGSVYAAGGGLMALNQALAEPAEHALALVGLPCQVLAASAMRAHPRYAAAGRLALVIGLFCTWNLPYEGLERILREQGAHGRIKRMDIPPPPAEIFELVWEGGKAEIPLAQVREHTLPGCGLCPDMTAELSDVSVGAVEGRLGWNTLIVRTEAGEKLLDEARQRGLLELEQVDEAKLAHLCEAADAKYERAQAAWKGRVHG